MQVSLSFFHFQTEALRTGFIRGNRYISVLRHADGHDILEKGEPFRCFLSGTCDFKPDHHDSVLRASKLDAEGSLGQ